MLDVRALAYVAPVAEQEIGPLTPIVAVQNFADEDARIFALFRIYRKSIGILEYSSVSATIDLAHGTTNSLAALTPFNPGAPADDDYFILCQLSVMSIPTGQLDIVQLGQYYFDVKPAPMGPPPATHHTTHEAGGMDPVLPEDLGTAELDQDLRLAPDGAGGVTWGPASAGVVAAHAANHEIGGSDEIEIVNLPTAENDDTLVLAPDGAGGVEFRAEAGGVTDHGMLTGLGDDDHPQYHLQAHIKFEDDCWGTTTASHFPWQANVIASGTQSNLNGSANHPGILRFTSSTSANSGYRLNVAVATFKIEGAEITDIIIRPQSLTDTTIRAGFLDTITYSAPVDGIYILMDPATGKITGRTMDNSAGSTTGTDYQLVTNTWYHLRIVVNSDATRVNYYCFDEAGNTLWTDNLTTNIPTGAARVTGHGIVATNSGTTAVDLVDIDYISAEIARILTR
jgi:hypothetical protein